ncbi:hypothetical protein A3J41_02830 [candidate division TM6 bacterium RIFCSPHIGHO2_12_FULL_38_8]|nr:MAG: hypothetical protein A3J41_02830 [candidate division TM6 bacterium RIFCSPHIGHO2_12_FULL_38_8]
MKCFSCYFFCSIFLWNTALFGGAGSSQFTSEELAKLQQERTTNLVILNDVLEYNECGAMHVEILEALSENQLVLSTKHLWSSVQDIVNQVNKSPSKEYRPDFQTPYSEHMVLYREYCLNMQKASSDQAKQQLREKFLAAKKKLPVLDDNDSNSIIDMMHVYAKYNQILTQGYSCKNVNDDFILFVPNKVDNAQESKDMQNALLGISYAKLADYDYKGPFSANPENDTIIDNGMQIRKENSLGKKLLDAVNVLKPINNEIPDDSRTFFKCCACWPWFIKYYDC